MRLALLTDGLYPYEIGGMQKHTYYLAKHLARAGARVDLYHVRPLDAPAVDEASLFTPDEWANLRLISVDRAPARRFPGHYVWESLQSSIALWEALKGRLDVNFIYAQGFAGWETIRQKRRGAAVPPVGVNFHGFEMWQKPASLHARLEQWLLRPFVRWNVEHADVALLLGRSLATVFAKTGVVPRHLVESPNGVTADWLFAGTRPEEHPLPRPARAFVRFVFIGRYERRKGIEELHQVIAKLAPDHAFHIDFVGPIPPALQLRSTHATYHGPVRDEEVMRGILREADVLICPSYAEGMPTVILEAMASGLAVIATDVGAVGDLVGPETGWMIPPGDTDALARTLVEVLNAPAAIEAKRRTGQERIRQSYLWNTVAHDTLRNIKATLT
ncbi:MAG: glycosyltransferase family 4 protein [Rhodothermales bacterium]|nr:glycosyltransferase family 4 protein [Rhodothermales bacterium]